VLIDDWNAERGTLRTFAVSAQGWQAARPATEVTIGRAGAAWGLGLHSVQSGPRKQEGDGRSPAGVFRIGTAFGYAPAAPTLLPYAAMSATHYCIDVPVSPLYNRIVDARTVGDAAVEGSTEPMRRDLHAGGDQRYELGFVIEHNTAGAAGEGSCIFAHVWTPKRESTAGCVAMAPEVMRELLGWLHPQDKPVLVLLPKQEYARLQAGWRLPPL
jgi:L,D-peptidoglycan transpeptidase YkuD (ErfK/YbiS/YcfS/YnhG family)